MNTIQIILKLSTLLFIISTSADEYREKIQPIFDNRCIACHSCLNGPCQLNLQNYDGFARGAHHENVYNGTRIKSVLPTRPNIDGKSPLDWRALGFFELNTSKKIEDNLFYTFINEKSSIDKKHIPFKNVENSAFCIDDNLRAQVLFKVNQDLKMPYGLPPISANEKNALISWIEKGSIGPSNRVIGPISLSKIKPIEEFFNKQSPKEKLVSRFLYEHLFLAHFYFKEEPRQFYRLIRSKNECGNNRYNLDEINSRRPNDHPNIETFFYCLKPLDLTIVAKTHLPFELSNQVVSDWQKLFFSKNWQTKLKIDHDKMYHDLASENPFEVFYDIPVESRYRFLLKNSHYIVSTFIKGPVCNGSKAVNSIQEQFYVMFIAPESDLMVKSQEFELKAKDLLILPGLWGSDINPLETISLNKKILDHREGYRKLRANSQREFFPKGYSINNLWDGDKQNDNAILTIFRHNDNAVVMKGFKGDIPKTAFFLDYALLERLVYNLVVNFDVYGNVTHQMLTRMYMDLIRMEGEEIFLSFLPPESRQKLRNEWYKGVLTKPKMEYLFPLIGKEHPTAIKFNTKNHKQEFFEKVFFSYLDPNVRGNVDVINWKQFHQVPLGTNYQAPKMTETEFILSELTSKNASEGMVFSNYLPENSYLLITNGTKNEAYNIIKNTEHDNISWILGEELRFNSDEDRVSILKGFYSYYPNAFFRVEKNDLQEFKNYLINTKNQKDYEKFWNRFGVSRVAKDFWDTYDSLNELYREYNLTESGYLDLTRYDLK